MHSFLRQVNRINVQSPQLGSADKNIRTADEEISSLTSPAGSARSMAMFQEEFRKVIYDDHLTFDTIAEKVIVLESNRFKMKDDGSPLNWETMELDGSVMYFIEICLNGETFEIDDTALAELGHLLFHFQRLRIKGVTVEGFEDFCKNSIPYVCKLCQSSGSL